MDRDMDRKNRIAQWAFNTRPVLGRFHLWLEDVEERWLSGGPSEDWAFVDWGLSQALIVSAAVTALGTRLYGRHGEGRGLDKTGLNLVKKHADAVSAYALSESLWYLARNLPEDHAIMVSLGEGLMPKAGETPEMGSNPMLGFGRVYARPMVARFVEDRVHRLLNDSEYGWDDFWGALQHKGITVWGAAIDTLENTSRFAKGADTGPMAVVHLFDQPLNVSRPYEGYMGALVLPQAVHDAAAEHSILCNYTTPRARVLEAIEGAYPGIAREHVHVWTLSGKSRVKRLSELWDEWRALGVHLVEDGWELPGGLGVFTESGTYAPTYRVGTFEDEDGATHLFLCDGYAASAEAIQAASLDPLLGLVSSMCLFSSRFEVDSHRESRLMSLDCESADFAARLSDVLGRAAGEDDVALYRGVIRDARDANLPVHSRTLAVDDLFPHKRWRGLALVGYMLPDPYTGTPGVEEVAPGTYRVYTRAAACGGMREVALTFRLMEEPAESRRVFSPLLDRFYEGEDYAKRAVKISDSGRIRNELQTWCSEALEFGSGDDTVRVLFDRIDDSVLSADKQRFIREVLTWYKQHHPTWFHWLEIA